MAKKKPKESEEPDGDAQGTEAGTQDLGEALAPVVPEEDLLPSGRHVPAGRLRFPHIVEKRGSPVLDLRDASLLLDEEHLLLLTYVEPELKDAYSTVLWDAMNEGCQETYSWIMIRLQLNAANKGFRSDQLVAMHGADKNRAQRSDYVQESDPRDRDPPYPSGGRFR